MTDIHEDTSSHNNMDFKMTKTTIRMLHCHKLDKSSSMCIFSICLDRTYMVFVICVAFCSFFFFPRVSETKFSWNGYCSSTVAEIFYFSEHQWIPCTVHKTHKLHFSSTFSLKMGLTALCMYLKIILLQCFQFQKNKFYPNGPLERHKRFFIGEKGGGGGGEQSQQRL